MSALCSQFLRYNKSSFRLGKYLSSMSTQVPNKLSVCEIERKFKVPPDYHQRLEKLGFELTESHDSLVDVYYDFSDPNSGEYVFVVGIVFQL